MSDRLCAPFVTSLLLWAASIAQVSAEAALPRHDDSSSGDLAVATTEAGPWQVVRAGDTFPAEGFYRTSAAGDCRVRLSGATLHLAADSRGRFDDAKRQMTLERGSLVIEAEESWSVTAAAATAKLPGKAKAELTIGPKREVTGNVLNGSVALVRDGKEAIAISADKHFQWKSADSQPAIGDLPAAEGERLRKTIASGPVAQGLGQLLVDDPQSGTPQRLNLARYHVNVVLQPPVALVQIDQSFFNPFDRTLEGTFLFNLPRGASVSRFAMYTSPTTLIEGELIDRLKASTIYQSIVNRRRDPAILEQMGNNLFRMRVFPIFQKDAKRILLDFTLPLIELPGGEYRFTLPLMSDLEPIRDFEITGTIRGETVGESLRSETHPQMVFSTADPGTQKFRFTQRDYEPGREFSVRFRQRSTREVLVQTYRSEMRRPGSGIDGEPSYFLATLRGDVAMPAEKQSGAPLPVDLLILADTSGGQREAPHVRRAVKTLVGSLRATDRFRLGAVDVDYRPLGTEWVRAGSGEASAGLAQFDQEYFLGASNYERSLSAALESLGAPTPGRRQLVIYVGDGVLHEGHPPAAAVAASVLRSVERDKARFCALLLGDDPQGRFLMNALARAGGGRVFDASARRGTGDLFGWALAGFPNPIGLVSVKAEGVAPDDLFAPVSWEPGEALSICGRRRAPGRCRLDVVFEQNGRELRREFPLALAPSDQDVFVGRLWGQRKLDELLGLQPPTGDPFRIASAAAIVALSQEWTLLSPLTAFLVLEREEEYAQYGINRLLRHKYWKPEEALVRLPTDEAHPRLLRAQAAAPLVTDERLARALVAAKNALENHLPDQAQALLKEVEGSEAARRSWRYDDLAKAIRRSRERRELLVSLGAHRTLFDRTRPFEPSWSSGEILPLLYGMPQALSGTHEHPAWQRLPVTPPQHSMSVARFAEWIASKAGLDMIIDETVLKDQGVGLDSEIDLRGIRLMSIRSLLRHGLGQQQLGYVIEDGVLKITTSVSCADRLDTRLYPVGDLIRPDQPPDVSLLANPDLDHRREWSERLEQKLDRRLTFEARQERLEDVIERLAKTLQDNVLIDRASLKDEGVALDAALTLRLRNLTVRSILKQICEPRQLSATVDDEAIVITTTTRAADRLETRIHPARGIVHEMSPARREALQNQMRMPGMFGGMGGGGMGGGGMGGGGMAGGLGGMGGGMGGGGMMGGAALPGPGRAGISEVDEPADAAKESEPVSVEPDRPQPAELAMPPATALQPPARDRQRLQLDWNSIMNLVRDTIQPDIWDDNGGPSSMSPFTNSLALVIRTTPATHFEIDELFERMRAVPTPFGPNPPYLPARIRTPSTTLPEELGNWDFNSLMNLIRDTVQPDTWDDNGGPGSMTPYTLKLLLTIRQTQYVQEEIRDLLTGLRRARYREWFGQPWGSFDVARGLPSGAPGTVTNLAAGQLRSQLPEPRGEELRLLSVRREPRELESWRSTSVDRRTEQRTSYRVTESRSELTIDGRVARLEGDEAAIAFPELTLLEQGPWSESLRRVLDDRLPWLPHRTNRELAQLFDVSVAEENEASVRIRLIPPTLGPGTWLELTIEKATGIVAAAESRLDGELQVRWTFRDRPAAGSAGFGTVEAADATGRTLQRWSPEHAAAPVGEIPALERSWPDFARLDVLAPDPARTIVPAIPSALLAIRSQQWDAAERALADALARQPEQPLLLFLRAWVLTQSDGVRLDEVAALLQRSMARSPRGLMRVLGEGWFPKLAPDKAHAILDRQPIAERTAADEDRLATVAIRAALVPAAIGHARAALAATQIEERRFAREALLVRLLAESGQTDEAAKRSLAWAGKAGTAPEEGLALAEILYHNRANAAAADVSRLARASTALPATGERRFRFLRRAADLETGTARWKTLLEANAAVPADSALRKSAGRVILSELTEPNQVETAGLLAEASTDQALRVDLLLRQAEFYAASINPQESVRIGWRLHESGQLPADRFEWFCRQLSATEQWSRLIELVEPRLRRGESIPQRELDLLALALDAEGRPTDAARARTNHEDARRPQPPAAPSPLNVQGMFAIPSTE